MSFRNTLANKKRKKIKFDATSGSISGYLRSSSDGVEVNNSSDNSLDATEVTTASSSNRIKGRLTNDFDDSFDLFTSVKVVKSSGGITSSKTRSPHKKTESILVKSGCPAKKSPVKKSNSPRGKSVKKCNYFNDNEKQADSLPCPFCFKFEVDISEHVKTNCVRRNCVNDNTLSQLIQIHSDYWNRRKNLGVPDFTLNEDEIFISKTSNNNLKAQEGSEPALSVKGPVLKWSKGKTNKYLLLRQSKAERETKITQKLAILLMGNEKEEEENNGNCQEMFNTVDKSIYSDFLEQLLLVQGLTFWRKSSLGPDEVTENTYYIEAFAPFVAPVKKTSEQVQPLLENEADNADEADTFIPICDPDREDLKATEHKSSPNLMSQSPIKDSCFSEVNSLEFISATSRDIEINDNLSTPLSNDWETLFYSSDLSDTTVLFSDGNFLGHSLVFWVRSIKIFRSLSSGSFEECGKMLDWMDIPSRVGKAFIKYIYTGKMEHFKEMECSDLKSIEQLCKKYDEFKLKAFVSNIVQSGHKNILPQEIKSNFISERSLPDEIKPNFVSESSLTEEVKPNFVSESSLTEEIKPNFVSESRNLTSPDMFEDLDNCDSPFIFNSSAKVKESVDSSTSSKRKLELSPDTFSDNDLTKRLKKDDSTENDADDLVVNDVIQSDDNEKLNKDDAISVSSIDAISLSSGTTLSPGRFENLAKRPLSQCSTLPPVSEDDKQESLPSPPCRACSPNIEAVLKPSDSQTAEKNTAEVNPVETDPQNSNFSENNMFYDNDTFDYNGYGELSFVDELDELNKPSSPHISVNCEPEKISTPTAAKHSLERYFNDSIPSNFLEGSEALSKTPQSVSKAVQGSPICQSTPTNPTTAANNLLTPTPQIIVSDQVTPMLNYSSVDSPDLKVELRKYGLKPDLDRKKAEKLLKHIYTLVHPIIPPGNDGKDEHLAVHIPDNQCAVIEKREEVSIVEEDEIKDSSQDKTNTSSESLLAFEHEGNENETDFEFESDKGMSHSQGQSSYQNKNELINSVSNFIKNDPVLFDSILQYVPIWLSKFHDALKERGIKCTRNDLMDVLDELCITFRIERKPKEPKKKSRRR